jgi:hypothetical protein
MEYPIPHPFLQALNDEHAYDWSSGPIRGQEHQMVRWIEVAELPPSQLIIGLSDSGSWVRGGGATVEIANGPHAISLLPCLECPSERLRQTLGDGLARRGLPDTLAETFPIEDLILAGLKSGSEYWTKLALERVGELGATPATQDALRDASRSAPTQPLRHRAGALLKQTVDAATRMRDLGVESAHPR